MVAKVDSVSAGGTEMVNFYIQASILGVRVVVLQLTYMVEDSKLQHIHMV